jgi:hypothetical protein
MKFVAKVIEHDGKKRTVAQWAKIAGVTKDAFRRRLGRGWPMINALNGTPPAIERAHKARKFIISPLSFGTDARVTDALAALNDQLAERETEVKALQVAIAALNALA